MNIKKVYINNFLSWGEGEFELGNRGILFIKGENRDTSGSNGSGKSTLIEAIIWTLFGDTVRGVDKVDDVINKSVGRDCCCTLELDNGYKITRARKHSVHENKLMLSKDGKELSKSSVKLTQDEINSIFNIDIDIFINSIVLANSNIRINFLDNKNNVLRRQVIENILGIDKFSEYMSIAKDKVKDFEEKKASLAWRVSEDKRQIKSYNDKIAAAKYEKEQFDIQQKRDREQFEIEKQERIKELSDDIAELKAVDVPYNLDIYQKIKKGQELEAKTVGNISGLKRSLKEFETKKSSIDKEIDKYSNFVDQPCRLCGTILDQEKMKTTIKNLESDKLVIDEQAKDTVDKINEYQKWIDDMKASLAEMKPTYKESDLYNIEGDITNLEERIEEIKKDIFKETRFQEISFNMDVDQLVNTIKENEKKSSEHTEEQVYYEFWKQGFGNDGLKIYILENMIKYLNKKVEFYLNILSKGQIQLEFDKYLDFKISGLNYRNCSSGERKRVDLAVLIALYDLTQLRYKSNYNLLILDEVLDSIDEIGVEAVKDLLLELNKRIPTILVVSHNNYLSEYFPNVVTIVKENGISRIE